jgi:hypothetical protein
MEKVKAATSLKERKGVFVHGFICLECFISFSIYSRKFRIKSVICPRCGNKQLPIHTIRLSTSRKFELFSTVEEIYNHYHVGNDAPRDSNMTVEDFVAITTELETHMKEIRAKAREW